jgi:hypothetical protein
MVPIIDVLHGQPVMLGALMIFFAASMGCIMGCVLLSLVAALVAIRLERGAVHGIAWLAATRHFGRRRGCTRRPTGTRGQRSSSAEGLRLDGAALGGRAVIQSV